MYDLCQALIPDPSIEIEPRMTLEESNLLGSKLGTHKISQIQFKDSKDVQKLKDFNAEIESFEGIEDLGLLKLMRMVPGLSPTIIVEAIHVEKQYKKYCDLTVTKAIEEEASQHIDIGLAYLSLGLVNGPALIEKLVKQCETKQAFIDVLNPILSRFSNTKDPALA